MTNLRQLSSFWLTVALAAAALPLGAQSTPPAPKRDTAPPPLAPPPSSPRPETVAPRSRTAAQVAPRATAEAMRVAPMQPRRVSAPADSARPAVAPKSAPLALAPIDPPPPRPGAQPAATRIIEPAAPDGPPPVGATARCKDGTYLYSPANSESCSDRGGLVVRFSPPPPLPTPPRRP